MQPVRALGKVDDVAGRELVLAFRRTHGQGSAEDKEHLLDAVVHVQRTLRRSRRKLPQGRAELVGFERVPEPADSGVVADLVPGLVIEEVQPPHSLHPFPSSLCDEIMLVWASVREGPGWHASADL